MDGDDTERTSRAKRDHVTDLPESQEDRCGRPGLCNRSATERSDSEYHELTRRQVPRTREPACKAMFPYNTIRTASFWTRMESNKDLR
jgi:hypothetical protein